MCEWMFFAGLMMAFIGFPTAFIDWASNKPHDTWTLKGVAMAGAGNHKRG